MAGHKILPGDLEIYSDHVVCSSYAIYRSNGLWEGPNPTSPSIPLFLIQLTLSIIATNFLAYAMKPFNQPHFVGELLAGILLGPSGFGRIRAYQTQIFPNISFKMLEPMSHYFICYYVFLVGLKIDPRACLQIGPKTKSIAVASTVIPFIVGALINRIVNSDDHTVLVFVGSALVVTGIPLVKEIMENNQFIRSDLIQSVIDASHINELASWTSLALALLLNKTTKFTVLATFVVFVAVSLTLVQRLIRWIVRKTSRVRGYSEFYLCTVLLGVSLYGALSDMLGGRPIVGCFLFGLMVPKDVFGVILVEKIEDFVVTAMMPVYVVVCGLRTDVDTILENLGWLKTIGIVTLACLAKPLSSLVVFIHGAFTGKDAIAAGLLGNAKSITALIIIELAKVEMAIDTNVYSALVVAMLLMTMIATPATIWFQPTKRFKLSYERRTIQKFKMGQELRILACMHTIRDLPPVINLLNTSNATNNSPVYVYALEMKELRARATGSSMIAHVSRLSRPENPTHTDQILIAFENLQLQYDGVWTETLCARFPYTTMGVDICNVARDKRTAFIILPYPIQRSISQARTAQNDSNPSLIRAVHSTVLAKAPCSVGMLVDKGFRGGTDHARNIALLYFGGPDDREALAYSLRIIETNTPDDFSKITIVRFITGDMKLHSYPSSAHTNDCNNEGDLTVDEEQMEKVLDEEYLSWFRTEAETNESIDYHELVLNNRDEMGRALKSMDEHKFELYLVGRGQNRKSTLLENDWCEYAELGPIGNMLVKSVVESPCLVLVFQQYIEKRRKATSTIKGVDGSYTKFSSMSSSRHPRRAGLSDMDDHQL